MKAELVRKTEEYIERLLAKPDLTPDEYMILDKKLMDIRFAESEAARKLSMEESEKKLRSLMDVFLHPEGGEGRVQ